MRVLLAVDGSDHSAVAMESLLERPWPGGTVVRVFTSVLVPFAPVDVFGGGGVATYNYEQLTPALMQQGQALVDRHVARLQEAGFTAEGLTARGDARVEIVAAAEDWPARLIVMGSHGHTGAKRWLLGSVAEYVVRHASCSVEVARRSPR